MRTRAAGLFAGLLLCGAGVARAEETPPPADPSAPAAPTMAEPIPGIPFKYTFHGFIRAGYSYVPYAPASSGELVGRDSGFRLYNSRLAFSGAFGEHVDFELSIDNQFKIDPTTGAAPITMGFADAYTTLHYGVAYLRIGQFKTPFNGEFLLDDQYVPFARRSTISEGILADESTNVQGAIGLDRQLGAMAGVKIPLGGKLALNAALAAVNGNGANQARNDNRAVALVGRVGLGSETFQVAASGYLNDRTVGTLAEREDERDVAGDLDFLLDIKGLHFGDMGGGLKIFGMAAYKKTSYLTVAQNAPKSALGVVGSASLPIYGKSIAIEPALRVSYYKPDDTLTDGNNKAYALADYTIGVNVAPRAVPMRLQINYTYRSTDSVWAQPNSLAEAVVQANF